jgi:hypothetical protein
MRVQGQKGQSQREREELRRDAVGTDVLMGRAARELLELCSRILLLSAVQSKAQRHSYTTLRVASTVIKKN